MKEYKIDRRRGYESNRRNIDLEGKERQRAKKAAKEGQLEPTAIEIRNDIQMDEYDRETLTNYLQEELGELLECELKKGKDN